MNGDRTIVIGLDGGHFELLNAWIEAGELPTIKKLLDTGVSGDLQSVLPPTTSPNWKAYSTGKNPGKLGIFWWENIDVENKRVYYPGERRSRHTEYWEIIDDREEIGVVGVPTTYPPREINGFYVSGAPDAEETGYTHPPHIEDELKRNLDYRVTKHHELKFDRNKATEEILDLIDLRFSTAKYLLEEFDISFLQVSTFYINSLHHFLWDDERTLGAWKTVDHHLADLITKQDNVILMSDHGSTPIQYTFHINSWLQQEGYLSARTASSQYLQDLGITTDLLIPLATKLGVRDLAEKIAPQWLINRIPNKQGQLNREQKSDAIDWEDSMAIASGQGPIYLIMDRSDPRYESMRTEIRQKLEAVRRPDGKPVVETVHNGEDIYTSEYASERPDLVAEQADDIHIPGGLGHEDVFTNPEEIPWIAENKQSGLFVAAGPDFSTGTIEGLSIIDLAPTLLHLHGCQIPGGMDGKVMKSVFKRGSAPHSTQEAYSDRSAKTDELRRIKKAVSKMEI